MRFALLLVFLFIAIALVVAGRSLFRSRRNRLRIEAKQREAEFLRMNTPRQPPQ